MILIVPTTSLSQAINSELLLAGIEPIRTRRIVW
jgi:hypothetical protein